jgi:CHAT domain-containing protein
MGDYPKALGFFEEAREIAKKLRADNNPAYAMSLNNLAALCKDMGDYPRALALYEQARDLRKKLLTENHPDYATSLNNLGTLHHAMGDYARALALLEQARELDRKLLTENHPDYARSLNNLATLYQAIGDYPRALPLLEQARDLYKKLLTKDHPYYATSLNNLGGVYLAMGDYPRALDCFQRARDLRKKALTENHPAYAGSLNNLAEVYFEMGDYPKALALHEQARSLYAQLLTESHPDYAQSLSFQAFVNYAMGEPRTAAQLLKQALAIRQTFFNKTFTALSDRQRLDFLARLKYSLNGYLSVGPPANTAPSALYEAVLAWKGAVAARAAEDRFARDRPDLQLLLEELRQSRAGLAKVALTPPRTAQQQPDWLKRFRDLESRKERLEIRLAGASAAYRHLRERRHLTTGDVTRAVPPGTALVDYLVYRHYTPPSEAKGAGRVERRLVAFVVVHGGLPVYVPLGPAEPVDQAVQAWRRAIVRSRTPDADAARELARRVWQPLRPHVEGVSTVLIAPDGLLCSLPFGALPGSKPGTYLLEELAIGYVTSGRHLLELAAGSDSPSGRGLLAVGGLAYGDSAAAPTQADLPAYMRKPVWSELPGSRLEVERVIRRYPQALARERAARLLTGDEADAPHLKRLLTPDTGQPRWRYLHLATHGFFEPPPPAPPGRPAGLSFGFSDTRQALTYGRNPLLLSGLVLSGANRSPEQGIITAEEVADLDLRGTELAVLSACETGLGKVAGGEGVLGLQRAFQAAGARSLAVSLWSVNDAATSVLMEEFYANLWQKHLPKLEALRRAQLTVLREPERVEKRDALAARGIGKRALPLPPGGGVSSARRRSPPAWWAAFVLSGDPGTLAPEPAPGRQAGRGSRAARPCRPAAHDSPNGHADAQ